MILHSLKLVRELKRKNKFRAPTNLSILIHCSIKLKIYLIRKAKIASVHFKKIIAHVYCSHRTDDTLLSITNVFSHLIQYANDRSKVTILI